MKNLLLFCCVLCVLVACGPPEKDYPAILKIDDRTFEIPRGYIDAGAPRDLIEDSILLKYQWPEFAILPTHPDQKNQLASEGRYKGMLLEKASMRPSLDYMASWRPKEYKKYYKPEIIYIHGLEKYEAIDFSETKNISTKDDFYISRNDQGEVTGFLRCAGPIKAIRPSCTDTFIDKKILYRIRWPLRALSTWREQRQAAIDFIDGFEVKTGASLAESKAQE